MSADLFSGMKTIGCRRLPASVPGGTIMAGTAANRISLRARRRRLLQGLAAAAVTCRLAPVAASAASSAILELPLAVRELLGASPLVQSGITLLLPSLAETGHAVALKVEVDSAMSGADRVRRIVVVAPRNPLPRVAEFVFGAAAPRASVVTRIRLAGSQQVYAVAAMGDGSVRLATVEVVVTQSACLDGS
jgi:sulfur-oxidizing protein SoxY